MGEMGEQGVEPVEFGYREPEPGCWTGAFDPRAIGEARRLRCTSRVKQRPPRLDGALGMRMLEANLGGH